MSRLKFERLSQASMPGIDELGSPEASDQRKAARSSAGHDETWNVYTVFDRVAMIILSMVSHYDSQNPIETNGR